LDAYSFDDLEEVRLIAEHWLEEYNTIRLHDALQGLSPANINFNKIPDFVYLSLVYNITAQGVE